MMRFSFYYSKLHNVLMAMAYTVIFLLVYCTKVKKVLNICYLNIEGCTFSTAQHFSMFNALILFTSDVFFLRHDPTDDSSVITFNRANVMGEIGVLHKKINMSN